MHQHKTRLLMLAAIALLLTGCTVNAEEHIGEAQGYGGPLRVSVTMDGARITAIRVLEHHETQGVGTLAIDALPDAMVKANSTEVDGVSGATITSSALKMAVQDAMNPVLTAQTTAPGTSPLNANAKSGAGMAVTGRLGPGVDAKGNPVYSINVVFASGLFDAEGRILDLNVDQLEFASPDASGMNQFGGWPEGTDQEQAFLDQFQDWQTKRGLGDSYRLTSGTWAQEMDAFQRLFTGMTVTEVDQWYAAHCSDLTGRPLTAGDVNEDAAKYAKLDDASRSALADVTTMATMSLRGVNGDILTAIRRAWQDASIK